MQILDILKMRNSTSDQICLDLNLCDPLVVTEVSGGRQEPKPATPKETHSTLNTLKVVKLTDIHVEKDNLQVSDNTRTYIATTGHYM